MCMSYKIASVPSEDSDQPAHLRSLIRAFTGHSMGSQGSKPSSGGQRRLISFYWVHAKFCRTLRKPAYSNLLKISPPNTESFPIKILIFFIFLLKNIDCGYSLESPRRGGSNE